MKGTAPVNTSEEWNAEEDRHDRGKGLHIVDTFFYVEKWTEKVGSSLLFYSGDGINERDRNSDSSYTRGNATTGHCWGHF